MLFFPPIFGFTNRHINIFKTNHNKDLDIDDNASHVEGSTIVMSAGESETESDGEQIDTLEPEISETPYILTPEDEFGDVSFL